MNNKPINPSSQVYNGWNHYLHRGIPSNLLLTKEAMAQHIKCLQEEQAKEFGLTLEEYQSAVISGSVVTKKIVI